jgi:hypothetical protein
MLRLALLAGVLVGLAGFVVLAYRREWHWTGLPAAPGVGDAEDRPAKTLWDWLQLLGIPLALASLAFLLNAAQSGREQQREDQRATRQRIVEDRRAAQQDVRVADAEQRLAGGLRRRPCWPPRRRDRLNWREMGLCSS